jgi:hypothetical protein
MDIRNRWNEVKLHLKKRYATLTDDDLVLYLGRESDLIQRLQCKLGKSKADVLRIIGEA